MATIPELLATGVVRLAREPADQPSSIAHAAGYTVPLIEHDYPALTARLWNAAYRVFGLPYVNAMVIADASHLAEITAAFRLDDRYLGGGAGIGFKDEIVRYLDEVDPLARAMGAANIIRRTRDGKLVGMNTDGEGFAVSLERALAARGKGLGSATVAIIGAGGAANAIAFALASRGARLWITNRTEAKARRLAGAIQRYLLAHGGYVPGQVIAGGEDDLPRAVRGADAVVNASTKGGGATVAYSALAPITLPATDATIIMNHHLAVEVLGEILDDAIVADIVIARGETVTLRQARETGHPTLDGVPMVVEQAIDAFRFIHGDELARRDVTRQQVAEVLWSAVRTHQPT